MITLRREEVLRFRPGHQALQQLARAKGTCAGLPQILSVAAGVRPATDDWVPHATFESYAESIAALGLVVIKDAVFLPLGTTAALGTNYLTTTRARGAFPDQAREGDILHVFIGADNSSAERAQAAGWYPLVIGDAVAAAAWSDAETFGAALGYPACCIRSFLEHNSWDELGHLQRLGNPGCIDVERNFFARNIGLSWTFPIPCSWSCALSLEQALATRDAMRGLDPAYAHLIEAVSGVPVLIFSERTLYLLFRDENNYIEPLFVGGTAADDSYGSLLSKGRELLIDGEVVAVYDGDSAPVTILTTHSVGTGAEVPVLYSFSSSGD